MRLRSVAVLGISTLLLLTACRPDQVPEPVATVVGAGAGGRAATTARPRSTTTTTRPRSTTTTTLRRSGGGGGGGRRSSTPVPLPTTTTTSTTVAPATTTTTAPAPAPSAPAGQVLWRSTDGWQAEQEPRVDGALQDRITFSDDPTRGRVMRVELRPFGSAPGLRDGDVTNTGGYEANRSEVYARHAVPGSAPAAQWPDPVGSTRWYGFDLFVPADFVTDTTGLQWITITQWKGYAGGSPPIAVEIKNDRLQLAGASGRDDLGPLRKGQWERLVVGVHFDPDAGWVEVYRDGQQALARTPRRTMDWRSPGVVDPTYFKQGIYRHWGWQATHVLLFGPATIGTTRDVVS